MDDKMNDVIDEVQKRLGEEYEVKRVEVMKYKMSRPNVQKILYKNVQLVCLS